MPPIQANEENMEQHSLQRNLEPDLQGGFWKLLQDALSKLRRREDSKDANVFDDPDLAYTSENPPRDTPIAIEREPTAAIPSAEPPLAAGSKCAALPSEVRIAGFVENDFIPEHVAMKELAGRTHYQAILKYVFTPAEVDRLFQVDASKSRTRLKAIPNWPYLDNVRLCDAGPEDVQRLISAAAAHGYSTQTVKHIRSVVSAIFTHAKQKQCFTGDNPARLAVLPGMTRKESHVLTVNQMNEVLAAMRCPEKELTLIEMLTSMNMAEICGLQWKRVNLTQAWCSADGEPIPPRTIAVRKQWNQGELSSVGRTKRHRNLTISEPLLPILLGLKRRAEFVGPDDFVLVSQAGTPLNAKHISHRLKLVGRALRMPWLSWNVVRRSHATLAYELGAEVLERVTVAMMRHSNPNISSTSMEREQAERSYTYA